MQAEEIKIHVTDEEQPVTETRNAIDESRAQEEKASQQISASSTVINKYLCARRKREIACFLLIEVVIQFVSLLPTLITGDELYNPVFIASEIISHLLALTFWCARHYASRANHHDSIFILNESLLNNMSQDEKQIITGMATQLDVNQQHRPPDPGMLQLATRNTLRDIDQSRNYRSRSSKIVHAFFHGYNKTHESKMPSSLIKLICDYSDTSEKSLKIG